MRTNVKYQDAELIALLKDRDQSAYTYLYDNYSGAIYSIILNIVHEAETAQDILQDVFVKIWKQIELYDSAKGRLFTWMLNVAKNTSIDWIRSKAHQNSLKNRELTETVYDAAGSTHIISDDYGLKKAVHQLKEDYKIIIDLAYFKGYTQDEISKLLDIPLGTVKTRMRAAVIELRKYIKT